MVYLDNAATTFPKPEQVYSAMDRVNREMAFNSGRGSYKGARDCAALIDETRVRIADLFHARGDADVVFTPSITHAFNQIIMGLPIGEGSIIYLSPYEHNAVARPIHARAIEVGATVELLPLTPEYEVDLDKTEFLFAQKKPDVVMVNALSNVTGYVMPAGDIFRLAKKHQSITVLDAAQAAGLLKMNMAELSADIICFAGHKTLMGPLGIAGFVISHGVVLSKAFYGGTGSDSLKLDMPELGTARYEASSPNIVAISGLLESLRILDVNEHYNHIKQLTDYLVKNLQSLNNVHVLGIEKIEPVGIVSFIVEGYNSDDVGAILDEEFDIAVRTGYHCAPFIHNYIGDTANNGSIRVGLGLFNTEADVDSLIEALNTL